MVTSANDSAGARMKRASASIALAILAGGCAGTINSVAIRTDGQPIAGNPVLQHAYETDEAICRSEMQEASMSGSTFSNGSLASLVNQMERQDLATEALRRCLAQKGYVIVRQDEAAAKSAEFQTVAEAARQQQMTADRNAVAITTGSIDR